jgi:hypothetical protein
MSNRCHHCDDKETSYINSKVLKQEFHSCLMFEFCVKGIISSINCTVQLHNAVFLLLFTLTHNVVFTKKLMNS